MRSRSSMILALASMAAILPMGGEDIGKHFRREPQEPFPPLPPPKRRTVAEEFPRDPGPAAQARIDAAEAKRTRKNAKRLADTQSGDSDAK